MVNEELDRLARKYGTDKGSRGNVGRSPKYYTRHYAQYLAHLRQAPIRLLEIGVDRGASLKMWEEYFPNGLIYGIDSRVTCLKRQSERIRVFVGDQADAAFLKAVVDEIGRPLNIVIDDGGHQAEQQAVSLRVLFPALVSGGLYAVEDLHASYEMKYGGGYRHPESLVERLKGLVDPVNGWGSDSDLVEGVESVHFYPRIAFLFRREQQQA